MILQKLDLQKILLWCCQTTCPTTQDCKNTGGLKKCKPKNLGLKKKPWFKPIVWTMQHYHKRTTLVSSAVVSYCILCNSMPYFYDILQYFLWQYMTYSFYGLLPYNIWDSLNWKRLKGLLVMFAELRMYTYIGTDWNKLAGTTLYMIFFFSEKKTI